MGTQLVMYDEEYNRINAVCDRLTKDANAKVVF
ncbi:MAG TPA: roadblock/LC7 domain-containing protein, partial [Myxococcaceae bacterium]|nr:roadblock/LC7 domain-containing protein [Myxococcaceae bacterium]